MLRRLPSLIYCAIPWLVIAAGGVWGPAIASQRPGPWVVCAAAAVSALWFGTVMACAVRFRYREWRPEWRAVWKPFLGFAWLPLIFAAGPWILWLLAASFVLGTVWLILQLRGTSNPCAERPLPVGAEQYTRQRSVDVYPGQNLPGFAITGRLVLTRRVLDERTPAELDAIVWRQVLLPIPLWVEAALDVYCFGCTGAIAFWPLPFAIGWNAAMLALGALTTWGFLFYCDRRAKREMEAVCAA